MFLVRLMSDEGPTPEGAGMEVYVFLAIDPLRRRQGDSRKQLEVYLKRSELRKKSYIREGLRKKLLNVPHSAMRNDERRHYKSPWPRDDETWSVQLGTLTLLPCSFNADTNLERPNGN